MKRRDMHTANPDHWRSLIVHDYFVLIGELKGLTQIDAYAEVWKRLEDILDTEV